MELFIAGVVHDDPLGRDNLTEWLHTLRQTHPGPPAFIAVEYASYDFAQIEPQRHMLQDLAAEIWQNAPPGLIPALAPSIAYEADTHTAVFPDELDVLWLDELRHNRPLGAVENFARDRLENYHEWWQQMHCPENLPDALTALSRQAWDRSDRLRHQRRQLPERPDHNFARDEQFAHLITDRLAEVRGNWAVVVVGWDHADDEEPRSMLSRLRDAGIPCQVRILDPRRRWSTTNEQIR